MVNLPSLISKQWPHSFKVMYLSLLGSHSSKKRVMQCSMGTRDARSGASSEWVKTLQQDKSSLLAEQLARGDLSLRIIKNVFLPQGCCTCHINRTQMKICKTNKQFVSEANSFGDIDRQGFSPHWQLPSFQQIGVYRHATSFLPLGWT